MKKEGIAGFMREEMLTGVFCGGEVFAGESPVRRLFAAEALRGQLFAGEAMGDNGLASGWVGV